MPFGSREIGDFRNLDYVNIGGNELTVLPAEI